MNLAIGGVGEAELSAERLLRRVLADGDLEGGDIVPRELGRYVVLARAGSGAMGVVYVAFDPALERRVALKVVRPQRAGIEGDHRLLREARALARLSHPSVVGVYDVFQVDGGICLALEHIEGMTLRARIRRGALDWHEALRVLIPAGEGLAAANRVGLVHRDFKPENVILGEHGRACVVDFGLAVELEEREPSRSGTPAYMAPEQLLGRPVDARADQWAFCAVAAEALLGRRLFTSSVSGRLASLREMPALEVDAPPALISALQRGLSHSPEHRHPSMQELLERLHRIELVAGRRWSRAAAGLRVASRATLRALMPRGALSRAFDATTPRRK